jgi:hypothetical protein
METHFVRKDCFPYSSPLFIFYSFLQTYLTLFDSILAVLNNNWIDMLVCLVRVVSMSLRINPHIQGLTQHPIKAIVPNITMKNVKIKVITPFHFF